MHILLSHQSYWGGSGEPPSLAMTIQVGLQLSIKITGSLERKEDNIRCGIQNPAGEFPITTLPPSHSLTECKIRDVVRHLFHYVLERDSCVSKTVTEITIQYVLHIILLLKSK
ncbi:hypothetical protein KIL84_007671 [Mauremys mutica]|uniref:Uncharacterized protein n=1 Tax=Mauremys mutica TaxID=74926 RepID=A0A9D3X3K3_9SAUR|nr:hypothetical protein KIL84_007671 [Mauremys mutica]